MPFVSTMSNPSTSEIFFNSHRHRLALSNKMTQRKSPPNPFGESAVSCENGPAIVDGIGNPRYCRRQQYQRALSHNIVVGMPIVMDMSDVDVNKKPPENMSRRLFSRTKSEARIANRSHYERSITHSLVNQDATKLRIMREYRELRMSLKPSVMIPPPSAEEESKLSSPYQSLLKELQAIPEDYCRS